MCAGVNERIQALWDSSVEQLDGPYTFEVEDQNWCWLQGLSDTQAFLVCIGAGPWKAKRRHFIQNGALEAHAAQGAPDLAFIAPNSLGYPLTWQVQKVMAIRSHLLRIIDDLPLFGPPFEEFCDGIRWERNPQPLYEAVGRSKVIELFVRDQLRLPSFPIDRHVRRALRAYKLPAEPDEIIQACEELAISPRLLSRMLFRLKSDNPNPGGSAWQRK
jgi:hypothetical protein